MSPTMYSWLIAIHVIGFIAWTGGLMSSLYLLKGHHAAPEAGRAVLGALQKRSAMIMDIGATLAIAVGLYLALGGPVNAFKTGGWLHAKLTLVVVALLPIHGYVRVKIKKFRNGAVAPIPAVLLPVLLLITAGIVILGAVKPF